MSELANRLTELIGCCDQDGFLPEKYNEEMLGIMVQYLEEGQKIIQITNENSAKMDELNKSFNAQLEYLKGMVGMMTLFLAEKNLENEFSQFAKDLTAGIAKLEQIN